MAFVMHTPSPQLTFPMLPSVDANGGSARG